MYAHLVCHLFQHFFDVALAHQWVFLRVDGFCGRVVAVEAERIELSQCLRGVLHDHVNAVVDLGVVRES